MRPLNNCCSLKVKLCLKLKAATLHYLRHCKGLFWSASKLLAEQNSSNSVGWTNVNLGLVRPKSQQPQGIDTQHWGLAGAVPTAWPTPECKGEAGQVTPTIFLSPSLKASKTGRFYKVTQNLALVLPKDAVVFPGHWCWWGALLCVLQPLNHCRAAS